MSFTDYFDFSNDMLASWRDDAACKGMSALFYPKDNERPGPYERRNEACKAVCARCPVRDDCIRWAMKDPLGEGIRTVLGGRTYEERAFAAKGRNLR